MSTNHVISIRDQRISVCDARVVAGSKDFDTFTVDADSEWDGLSVVVAFGSGDEKVLVSYGGEPAEIPRQVISSPGWLAVSVVGYGDGGEVRATTVAALHAINVLPDGQVPDNPYPDSPDMLGQLVAAAERAESSADAADEAASKASLAADDGTRRQTGPVRRLTSQRTPPRQRTRQQTSRGGGAGRWREVAVRLCRP